MAHTNAMRFELYYDNGIFGGTFGSMIIARREGRDELGWQQIMTLVSIRPSVSRTSAPKFECT
jgi:hypothetical protein